MPSLHVLVIEDEMAAREVLAAAVRNAGYSVDVAATAAQARAKLAAGDVDVALCDIQLPGGNGVEILRQSRAAGQNITFIMVTGFASVETAVEALRAGAHDYIIKPVRHKEVLHRLAQIEALRNLRQENTVLRKAQKQSRPTYTFNSPAMLGVERLVGKIAATSSTVLITGESGTGKGVMARSIRERGDRSEAPFVSVNCGAIPEQLLESEFFGYVKGAFTGADKTQKGLFLEADGGTLFLDEIGELPLPMQTKLLNVIEDKEIRPLGSGQTRRVDTRIIAATNRNLADMVGRGKFREDLYFRLSMFQIHIPPLRERPDDLRGLIRFFLRINERAKALVQSIDIDPDAEKMLLRHHWSGNVRELENVITRACILLDGNSISAEDLPREISKPAASAGGTTTSGKNSGSLTDRRRKFEAEVILGAIKAAGGDRKLAAQNLGISLSSLYGKLQDLLEGEWGENAREDSAGGRLAGGGG